MKDGLESMGAKIGRLMGTAALASILWIGSSLPALAQAGDLDLTFSGDGIARTNFTPRGDFAWAIAVQADGKIVAAGASGGGRHFALARYSTDGRLDTTFGGDGRVVTPMTTADDIIHAVEFQADQRIVVAGQVGGKGGRYGLARYNTDGSLDTSFGGDGRVMTNLTRSWDLAWGLAVQPDGGIVAVGASGFAGGGFSAVRYLPNGRVDTTFSVDGKAMNNFTSGDDWAWDVALQADGKIVVAGIASASRSDRLVAMLRYNGDGTLDTAFSGDGKLTRNVTRGWDDASGVEIQPDGKIVTAGAVGGFGGRLLVLRFDADGRLDPTFSGDGIAAANFTRRDDFAWDLTLQTDGKVVAAGTAGIGAGEGSFAVARYGTGSRLDSSFGGDGKVVTDVTTGIDVATAVAVQADGAIVVGGEIGRTGGRFGVARYLAA